MPDLIGHSFALIGHTSLTSRRIGSFLSTSGDASGRTGPYNSPQNPLVSTSLQGATRRPTTALSPAAT